MFGLTPVRAALLTTRSMSFRQRPRSSQRCILMATDPGDLVLDPTCGSGTTAYVAEQWGRRWITIDTSRVALALARTRLMAARYPWYLLADSREGRAKEAELTQRVPADTPVHNDLRQGFVYERVPHITLKSIANNPLIDDIWEKWQAVLEPLRAALNAALGKTYEEWQIPRDLPAGAPASAKEPHAKWWEARIARQREIDASIAARADVEYLYDKPYVDNARVRVAGPVHGRKPVAASRAAGERRGTDRRDRSRRGSTLAGRRRSRGTGFRRHRHRLPQGRGRQATGEGRPHHLREPDALAGQLHRRQRHIHRRRERPRAPRRDPDRAGIRHGRPAGHRRRRPRGGGRPLRRADRLRLQLRRPFVRTGKPRQPQDPQGADQPRHAHVGGTQEHRARQHVRRVRRAGRRNPRRRRARKSA